MWQSLSGVGNTQEWKAQNKLEIGKQFVATSPNQGRSEAAAKNRQAARTRVVERQSLHIESVAEP
jgi:hypothetical protein